MNENRRYDVTIIGAGPGGYVAAIRAAQLGMKTALIEKYDRLGGTCLNIGCIPSKALLDISEEYYRITKSAAERGINVADVSLDLTKVMAFKTKTVNELTNGIDRLMKEYKVDVHRATGRLLTQDKIELTPLEDEPYRVSSDRIVLATGSVPIELPFLPFNGNTIISSSEVLSLDTVPKHLIVIGAGAIGLELGSVWARFGSKVTVIELLPQILPGTDSRVSKTLRRLLTKQGMSFHLDTKVTGVKESGDEVTITAIDAKNNPLEIRGDRVLVAVGRKPFTEGLDLDAAGVSFDSKTGRISVDEKFKTSVDNIYAIGDIIDGPMLAHKAEEEGIAVADIIAGKPGLVNHDIIPGIVYTWPEVATVGKSEEQVKQHNIEYKTGLFNFRANGRALCMGEAEGFVKIIAEKDTDSILGAHIIGPWASDLIAEVVSVMEFGGSAEDLARTVHAHPTLSEAVKEAAMAVDDWSIHSAPPKKR